MKYLWRSPMSHLGHFRKSASVTSMPALTPEADIAVGHVANEGESPALKTVRQARQGCPKTLLTPLGLTYFGIVSPNRQPSGCTHPVPIHFIRAEKGERQARSSIPE
jgi:hypothetical protein